MGAPSTLETDRLTLRRPRGEDVTAILERYASDAEVTRYLAWPRHRDLVDTRAFLELSDADWARWPAGPYLICSRADGSLLGATGLAFETPQRASTGYVLARDAWGRGYATEALRAVVGVAESLPLTRIHAMVHVDHEASRRVLEKCGFDLEGTLRGHSVFPNLAPGVPCDVHCYARILRPAPTRAAQARDGTT